MSLINIIPDKNKLAIVVVGFNRVDSIKRLLVSLEKAKYPFYGVPLIISIDASDEQELYDYVNKYEWSYGPLYINIQEKRLGLRNHIIQCGDYTQFFKGIILLEDDLFVSEYFYSYALKALDFYFNEERIGGFSLYKNEVSSLANNMPVEFVNDGSSSFLMQSPATWGEFWSDKQWSLFKSWYNNFDDSTINDLDLPECVKQWKKAWSKYYMAYLIQTERFFLFPNISHTTCFTEVGEHGQTSPCLGQVNLLCGLANYSFRKFEELVCYDIFLSNMQIYEWMGIPSDELCVDLYGFNPNASKFKYILSPYIYNLPIIKKYGLRLHPIELNIKYEVQGSGLFLYSNENSNKNICRKIPLRLADYYLRNFNIRLLLDYSYTYIKNSIKRKLSRS